MAINTALNNSRKGDVIVLLSKGIDKHQRIKNKEVPYKSDVTIVEKRLKIRNDLINIKDKFTVTSPPYFNITFL